MNRRTYLGVCAGAGVAALAGCLDAVGGQVARTEATPAFLLTGGGDCDDGDACVRPHLLRALDREVDSGNPALGTLRVRGWLTGTQLRTQNHNTTRSNRTARAGDPDSDGDGVEDGEETRANNHNTTRSNRTQPVSDGGDGGDESIELERAFDYLEKGGDGDGVLVGETFVVTAPVVDLPGVTDHASETGHADYVRNMVGGARSASPTGAETALRGLTTPTRVEHCCKRSDRTTPLIYLSTPRDGDEPMAGAWEPTSLRGETGAPDQSAPAVGRAVATLDGGVKLPVLVWTQHLVHEGDHLFVAGWALDEARLYGNAATVLTAAARTPVSAHDIDPSDLDGSLAKAREAAADRPLRRNPSGEEPPEGAVLAAARDAPRPDAGTDGDWMGLFVVPLDAPLAHGRPVSPGN